MPDVHIANLGRNRISKLLGVTPLNAGCKPDDLRDTGHPAEDPRQWEDVGKDYAQRDTDTGISTTAKIRKNDYL